MKVQISDIISGKDRSKKIDYTFDAPQFDFEGDIIKPIKPCEVVGKIASDGDILILNAKIKTDLEMICSRCLDTFIYPIDIDIEERFTTNRDSDDDEAIVVMDDVLDITEIVESSIISTLPIKRVCKNDCKGLCQECGCNLNHNSCSCQKEDVDIRFEALKGLFDNKEV
ncbi:YceD family protein [Clostridium beijerinckii]|uniref:DUF177 domain-containing protein n=2 Tax=Clostridium TaxID=1485 RepID=A0A1S8T1N1_CLOBE|nr:MULTISPECIES: DUF177 domain-containing protein [Clostridium]MBA8936782.1 uncharacterized protein [Clostridium beijerinckii]MBN7574761.1 DUF177 domain-containing protein [Clostridium beijerinckii]MBN7580058.1 DUF177 domain-containing protein [Clostridium beijerinckii]MBN7584525.1 DUF177 domain-containing protein [Clostridium beijerinckii]MBO0520263.1 DUF177 domain-containing protein [Clostridium beijerinckii]